MSNLAIEISRTEHLPDEIVSGAVAWEFASSPKAIEVRLFWFTRGKGTVDAEVVAKTRIEQPLARDRQRFALRLPTAPFSFSGKLVSLIWAVEIMAEPGGENALAEIVMSPNRAEIVLPNIETAEDRMRQRIERRLAPLAT